MVGVISWVVLAAPVWFIGWSSGRAWGAGWGPGGRLETGPTHTAAAQEDRGERLSVEVQRGGFCMFVIMLFVLIARGFERERERERERGRERERLQFVCVCGHVCV